MNQDERAREFWSQHPVPDISPWESFQAFCMALGLLFFMAVFSVGFYVICEWVWRWL